MIYIILLPLLIIYPYFISKKISDNTTINKKTNNGTIVANIGKILGISLITLIIMGFLLSIYDGIFPDSTSDACTNGGGWIYSCEGNSKEALPILLSIGIVIAAHHFITQKFIYEIFKNSKKLFKYIYMYIHMFATYFLNIWLIFYLYGLFISLDFDSAIVENIRFFVTFSPTALYLVSTAIYKKKNKN